MKDPYNLQKSRITRPIETFHKKRSIKGVKLFLPGVNSAYVVVFLAACRLVFWLRKITPLYGEDPWYVTGITNFVVVLFLSSVMVFKKIEYSDLQVKDTLFRMKIMFLDQQKVMVEAAFKDVYVSFWIMYLVPTQNFPKK